MMYFVVAVFYTRQYEKFRDVKLAMLKLAKCQL